MTLRSTLLLGIATLALAACSMSKPASDLYVLRAPEADGETCTKPGSLVINRPSAPNEYDTKRIAVMLDHNHLTYYTGASWASPFPDQLQDFLTDAFTQQGMDVIDDGAEGADSARKLRMTIHEADVTDVNAPIVHLRLSGTVTDSSGRAKRFRVKESIPAEENHMPQIVDAYDQAAMNAASSIRKAMKLRCAGIPAGD